MFEMACAAAASGNRILYHNFPKHTGSCGYNLTNYAIQKAKGKYLVFFANDDIILPNHFNNYLEIEKTDLDFMYFNSLIGPGNSVRVPVIAPSRIGHSEIIVNTMLAKACKPHSPRYGHDWDFIKEISEKGKGAKATSTETTYHIMHVPNLGTVDFID